MSSGKKIGKQNNREKKLSERSFIPKRSNYGEYKKKRGYKCTEWKEVMSNQSDPPHTNASTIL